MSACLVLAAAPPNRRVAPRSIPKSPFFGSVRISRTFPQHAVFISNAHTVVLWYFPTAVFAALKRTPLPMVASQREHPTSKGSSNRIVGCFRLSLAFLLPSAPFAPFVPTRARRLAEPPSGVQSGG